MIEQMTNRVREKARKLPQGFYLYELDQGLQQLIQTDFPKMSAQTFISDSDLLAYRMIYLKEIIASANGKNERIRESVTEVTSNQAYQQLSAIEQWDQKVTFGQRLADGVARFGGSWTFIISFMLIMGLWMLINQFKWFGWHFDPYPFILLNLALSTLAAVQAPLIMMSQNRASDYDRLQAKNDFKVNQKAEEGIRFLHTKIDHLVQQDQSDLLEIQKLQSEMLVSMSQQITYLQKTIKDIERKFAQDDRKD